MKYCLSLILAILSLQCLLAQVSTDGRQYFDKTWRPTRSEEASYYRIINSDDGKIIARDYFVSGKLYREAECNQASPEPQLHGKVTWYNEQGKIIHQGSYENNKPMGLHIFNYEHGRLRKEVNYYNGEIVSEYWSEEGKPLIINKMSPNQAGAIPPKYPGGYKQLTKDLKQNLRYPSSSADAQGTVYVSFIVGKEGDIIDTYILKGIEPEYDRAAMEAVSKLKKWKPGKQDGKPVYVRYVLPVIFSIE